MYGKACFIPAILLFLLAACGGSDSPPPTAVPTLTPEPTLTFEERIAFSPGAAENPLQMVVHRLKDVEPETFEAVESTLLDRTGIYFDVVLVETYAEALAALCNSGDGVVSITWLDGITYAAAKARNCGQAALQVAAAPESRAMLFAETEAPEITPEPTDEATAEATNEVVTEEAATAEATVDTLPPDEVVETDEATPEATAESVSPENLQTGTTGLVIVNEELGSGGLSALNGGTFCRISETDFFTWFLPTLLMQEAGIDPQRTVTVDEYETIPELIAAVADGSCDGTGLSQDTYDALGNEFEDELDETAIVATTVTLPYDILMYPLEIQLGVRLTLNEQLPLIATENDALRQLLSADAILPLETDSLAGFDAFIASTGLDFAQLGD